MADKLTSAQRSVNMAKIRARDTKPELAVRRLLHAAGYRYRLHGKGLPGKPDIVFSRRRKVIFVHGCFWHQHDKDACLDGRRPKSNTEYWHPKLARNMERDRQHVDKLMADGWEVTVVWECELRDQEALTEKLYQLLGATAYHRHATRKKLSQ
jgi:DNA mismatch endonuclease (patch repair protein)